jgi:preprotein translocase subunit SecB
MAENTPTPPQGGDAPAGAQPAEAPSPRLTIVSQYIKDLSFENPRAPASLEPGKSRPEIGIRVDAQAKNLAPERYEVTFQLQVDAKSEGEPVFMVELVYAGLFSLANIPQESLQPVLLIECPRLLFPFARRIVADVTRDGGFPPLMIDPIDFVSLYRRRTEQAKAQSQAAAAQPQAKPQPGANGGEVPV